jgi:hypothetical protein
MQGWQGGPSCPVARHTDSLYVSLVSQDLPPPPPPPQPSPQGDATKWILPVGRSGWAIAAGYAGLFALLIYPAPLALALSLIAMRHLRRSPKLLGWGRAVFALVTGLVGTVILTWIHSR